MRTLPLACLLTVAAAQHLPLWHVSGRGGVEASQHRDGNINNNAHTAFEPELGCCVDADVRSTESCHFLRQPWSSLVHAPAFRPPSLGVPCLAYERLHADSTEPVYSILINVFNSAARLRVVTTQLLKMTTGAWELVALFDSCSDDSMSVMRETLDRSNQWPNCPYGSKTINTSAVWQTSVNLTTYQGDLGRECWLADVNSVLTRVAFINVPGAELRETASNNLMMLTARATVFIILQDDQIMTQPGWNVALSVPLVTWLDVFSVSARCAHAFPLESMTQLTGAKCVDSGAVHPTDETARCMFYVRDSGNRGPLALRAEYVKRLGYLDEVRFDGSGDDEHDINTRAWVQHGWVSGHAPVDATEERCCRSPKGGGGVESARKVWWRGRLAAAMTRGLAHSGMETAHEPGDHDDARRIELAAFADVCAG